MNGQVFVTEDGRNSVAFYACNTGFRPVEGDIVRLCQPGGTYSGRAPQCIRKYWVIPIIINNILYKVGELSLLYPLVDLSHQDPFHHALPVDHVHQQTYHLLLEEFALMFLHLKMD